MNSAGMWNQQKATCIVLISEGIEGDCRWKHVDFSLKGTFVKYASFRLNFVHSVVVDSKLPGTQHISF